MQVGVFRDWPAMNVHVCAISLVYDVDASPLPPAPPAPSPRELSGGNLLKGWFQHAQLHIMM